MVAILGLGSGDVASIARTADVVLELDGEQLEDALISILVP